MNDLISIIVPVYNVELFLNECVDSLINQTYKNLEIILIDDGSTDNSGIICDNYCNMDSRVKVIHKKNGGLSSARNAGLDYAHGSYVSFVDSDDFVSNDFIEFLYNGIIQSEKDISICGVWHYYDNNMKKNFCIDNTSLCLDKIESNKFLYIIGYYDIAVWNKMYKKCLFDDIRFPLNKKSEDVFVQYKLFEKSNGSFYNSSPKYFYRQRNNSITKSTNINYDVLEGINNAITFYEKKHYDEVIKFSYRYLVFAYIGIYNACICRTKNYKEAKRIRKECLKYKNKINYNFLSKARCLQIILFLYFIFIYDLLFKIYFKNQKYF